MRNLCSNTFGAVTVGIHWEALRLWLKGLTIKSRPPRGAGHAPPAEEPAR